MSFLRRSAQGGPRAVGEESSDTTRDGVTEHGGSDPASPVAVAGASPYGNPGKQFDRRSPFFIGFFGALGALLAYWLFNAVASIGSTLLLVVVAFFLAAGLNPSVEFLERRGLRRSLACALVIVVAIGTVALFIVAIVPVISDQVRGITENAPTWLDQLQKNRQIQELNDEYDIIDKTKDYVAKGDFISTLFGGVQIGRAHV